MLEMTRIEQFARLAMASPTDEDVAPGPRSSVVQRFVIGVGMATAAICALIYLAF